MQHEPAEGNATQPGDRLSVVAPNMPRESEILTPLAQILWGNETFRTDDQPSDARLSLDLGAMGPGCASDDPQLLTLASALGR